MAQLLDQYGRPISSAQLKTEQAAPEFGSVRQPVSRPQASGLTPGRLARMLRGATDGDPEAYLELAEDMEERDLHYAGVLSIRKRQVSGLEITVEAASDSAEDVRNADLIREVISRDEFEDELVDILDAIGKGFSCTEIIWDTSEGQWMPEALKWRDPRWFVFDREDGDTLMLRSNSGDEELAPYKWIRHRSKTKSGLTIRGGLARSVAWTFLFKHFTISDWAIFCEAYGQPLRLGKFGPGATDDQKQILLQAVQNIGTDFAAIVPDSMAIEFVEASISGSHELYERRADWLDRQVSKLVLGQTQTTDAQAGGYAVGKVHDGVRDDIERADAKQLGATINRDLVRPLIDLNHGPQKKYPKVKIGRPDEVDIDKLVSNVTKLVPLGLKVGASTMRDKLSLPDPDPKEELLQPRRQSPQTEPTPPLKAASRSAQSVTQGSTADDDAIDRTVNDIVDDEWEELVSPMINGLEEKLSEATTIEEARMILAKHFLTMDTDQFAKRLAEASFGARLAGLYNEELDGDQ